MLLDIGKKSWLYPSTSLIHKAACSCFTAETPPKLVKEGRLRQSATLAHWGSGPQHNFS